MNKKQWFRYAAGIAAILAPSFLVNAAHAQESATTVSLDSAEQNDAVDLVEEVMPWTLTITPPDTVLTVDGDKPLSLLHFQMSPKQFEESLQRIQLQLAVEDNYIYSAAEPWVIEITEDGKYVVKLDVTVETYEEVVALLSEAPLYLDIGEQDTMDLTAYVHDETDHLSPLNWVLVLTDNQWQPLTIEDDMEQSLEKDLQYPNEVETNAYYLVEDIEYTPPAFVEVISEETNQIAIEAIVVDTPKAEIELVLPQPIAAVADDTLLKPVLDGELQVSDHQAPNEPISNESNPNESNMIPGTNPSNPSDFETVVPESIRDIVQGSLDEIVNTSIEENYVPTETFQPLPQLGSATTQTVWIIVLLVISGFCLFRRPSLAKE